MTVKVAFLQGGGEGAHAMDALLAAALQRALGDDYDVVFPEMPDEGDPDYDRWRPAIAEAVEGAAVVVGHSLGGYLAAKYFAEAWPADPDVVCLLAAPFPSGDADWVFDGFELPEDFADALPGKVFLYASPDDDTVPFAHRDLYAAAIPRAVPRTASGGHQFGNDLDVVAVDILSAFH